MISHTFPKVLTHLGYTEKELEKDNPHNQWMKDMEVKEHKNPLVIYHANCADGFSAAWVFHYMQDKLETAFDFHPGVYNEPPPDVEDRIVYLVDFSYKKDVVVKMCEIAKEVWLIDHHKTALEDLLASVVMPANFYHYTDLERSGAMLAWDFWNNSRFSCSGMGPELDRDIKQDDPEYIAPPLLLAHVQDRDLWRFKLPRTREIQAGMFSYEYTFENWDALMLGVDPHMENKDILSTKVEQITMLSELARAGAAIERKHHKDIAELVKLCQRILTINGHEVPVASLPHTMSSDAGHLMAKEYADGTLFAACYWDTPTHRIFSLRSTERGMDVSLIASQYPGGGGHKHAAGFRVSRTHFLAML
jgi:uncharacterized protein